MLSSRAPGRAAHRGTAAQSRRRKIGKRVLCAVILCGAAVPVGVRVGDDVQATDSLVAPAWIQSVAHADRQDLCIYNLIRREVPRGAPIYVNSSDVAYSQRLAELSTLWAIPQRTQATAKYLVFIYPGDCYGVSVGVQRI